MNCSTQPIDAMTTQGGKDQLVDLEDVAARLVVSKRSVWRLIASGDLVPPVKIGRLVRWFEADLQSYLDRKRQQRETVNRVVATRRVNHEDVGVSDANASGNSFSSNQAPLRRQRRSS